MAADPFQPVPLFAFPLFSSLLGDAESHREPLTRLILDHRSSHAGIRRSNRDGWHSGPEFLTVQDEHLAWVLHNVTVFAQHALGRFYGGWARHELRLGSWWANVLDQGGWNAPHHHLPQHWSGAYYVDVPDVGTTPDDLHGRIEFLNPNVTQSAYGSGNFAYAPKDGLTVMFPSSLLHFVHPHKGTRPRISIAYNFNVVAKD
jgi:uncharacterized protein (TIGR02466 family)